MLRTVEQAVESAIEHQKTYTPNDPSRTRSLRVSSFPFCPVKWFFGLPTALSSDRESDFMGNYFTSVGTAVHTNIQSAVENSPNAIRDWDCMVCKHNHPFQTKPTQCLGCGKNTAYVSKESQVKNGVILGHIDDAWVLTSGIWIGDYKTTSKAALNTKKLPHVSNVRQIEAYCALKSSEGYDIAGWTLIYIARDTGARRYINSDQFYGHSYAKEYPEVVRRVKKYVKDFKFVSTLSSEDQLDTLLSLRRLQEHKEDTEGLCGYCPYQPACKNDKHAQVHTRKIFKIIQRKLPICGNSPTEP